MLPEERLAPWRRPRPRHQTSFNKDGLDDDSEEEESEEEDEDFVKRDPEDTIGTTAMARRLRFWRGRHMTPSRPAAMPENWGNADTPNVGER